MINDFGEATYRYDSNDDEIREAYFNWLVQYMELDRNHLIEIGKILHSTQFIAINLKDRNRAFDGKALREQFKNASLFDDYRCLDGPCSVLELLIGIAIRIDYLMREPGQSDQTVKWFYMLLDNLHIAEFTDDHFGYTDREKIKDILNKFILRKYNYDGEGGLFPLHHSRQNQTKIEIWYQMSAFLTEKFINN